MDRIFPLPRHRYKRSNREAFGNRRKIFRRREWPTVNDIFYFLYGGISDRIHHQIRHRFVVHQNGIIIFVVHLYPTLKGITNPPADGSYLLFYEGPIFPDIYLTSPPKMMLSLIMLNSSPPKEPMVTTPESKGLSLRLTIVCRATTK